MGAGRFVSGLLCAARSLPRPSLASEVRPLHALGRVANARRFRLVSLLRAPRRGFYVAWVYSRNLLAVAQVPGGGGNILLMRKLERTDLLATLLLLVYTVIFSWLTIRQHDGFGTHALDLAKFDQAIWNTAQGRPFRISLVQELVIQSHFSPSLALYAPLYWIWSDIRLLFVLQSVFFAGAGFLIYWFFRDDKPWLGLAVYAAYLMHPSLHQVNLVEFRRLTLAVLGTSFVLYHLLRRHYGWMALGLLVILFSKEDMSFTVIGVGLYVLVIHRSFKIGLLLLVIGMVYLAIVPFAVLPALNADSNYRHAEKSFAYLGDSPAQMVRSVVTNPVIILRYVLRGERLSALFRFLWPTLFLCMLAPEIAAFLVPYLGYLLSSTSDTLAQLGAWYPSVLLVFLYWAVARGAWRLPKQWQRIGLGFLLISGFSGWLLYSQLWPGANFQARLFRVTEHDRKVGAVLQRVPTQSTVAAQDALVPHLSHREKIYLFPWVPAGEQVDYVALDRSMGTYPLPLGQYRTYFYDVFAAPEYEIEYQVDDFYLFRRVEKLAPDVTRQDTWNDSLTWLGTVLR